MRVRTFCVSGAKKGIPGVEFSGGSLGIGLGVACGMAYAAKMSGQNYKIYVLVGDGECYEGAIWESIMFAAHNNLDNLIMYIDRNHMAITDYTENMLKLEPLEDKLIAFGWNAETINGHDIDEILMASLRKTETKKPRCIICNTVKGNGVSSMSNKMFKHGIAPRGKEAEAAISELEERIKNGI